MENSKIEKFLIRLKAVSVDSYTNHSPEVPSFSIIFIGVIGLVQLLGYKIPTLMYFIIYFISIIAIGIFFVSFLSSFFSFDFEKFYEELIRKDEERNNQNDVAKSEQIVFLEYPIPMIALIVFFMFLLILLAKFDWVSFQISDISVCIGHALILMIFTGIWIWVTFIIWGFIFFPFTPNIKIDIEMRKKWYEIPEQLFSAIFIFPFSFYFYYRTIISPLLFTE